MVTPVHPDFLAELTSARLLAIVRSDNADAAIAASLALVESGIRFLEISLVSTDAERVIREVSRHAAGRCSIGAGTVLTVDDVARSADAGAEFIVTPAVADSVSEAAGRGLPVLAGALTPTEAVTAMGLGATAVKLFPASSGGPAYLRALREPLPGVPFVPVGGVDVSRAREYFAAGAVAVGLGSPLLGDAAHGGDLSLLKARAAEFLAVAAETDAGA